MDEKCFIRKHNSLLIPVRGLFLIYLFLPLAGWSQNGEIARDVGQTEIRSCRIPLSSELLSTNSNNDSEWMLDFLSDEQEVSVASGEHPVSAAWEPSSALAEGDVKLIVNLGKVYHITQLALHNQYPITGLSLSFGSPGNWTDFFSVDNENCNSWNACSKEFSSQFILLKASKGSSVSINELLIEGFDPQTAFSETTGNLQTSADPFPPKGMESFSSFDDLLKSASESLEEDPKRRFTFDFYSMWGVKIKSVQGASLISIQLLQEVSRKVEGTGIFIMHYHNQMGVSKQVKFQKVN